MGLPGYQSTQAPEVTVALGLSSPTEARHCGPFRGMGSTGRQQSQGKSPPQFLVDLREDQTAHLLYMCRGMEG